MTSTPKLPIAAAAATLFVLSVGELFLRDHVDPLGSELAVRVVIFGTLVLLPRAPTLVLALLLVEIFVVREFGVLTLIGAAGGLLTLLTATFSAAALVPARRLPVLVALLAAHMVWRATLPTAEFLALYADTALYIAALTTGAMLQRRHRRLVAVLEERDRLVAALETGPGAAATAEQLRTWSLLEQRIEPVIDALPAMVSAATVAPEPQQPLEAIRAAAADALTEMQATIHVLGNPAPAVVPEPLPPPPRRPRTLSPLWVACALLLVAAILEMIVARELSVYALVLALLPLLAPRAPVTTSALVALTAIALSLAGEIPVGARAADFSAILTLLVAGTSASPRRAVASLVLVVTGLLVSQGLDPTFDWPTVAFVASACVYLGHWIFGLLLRDVAQERRLVNQGLREIADALAELEARAVRRERVRMAHELHDLVGHALTALTIQAGAAKAQLKHGRRPDFAQLAAAAAQGTTELCRLARVLGHETDVTAELARVTDTARATGQDVELHLDEEVSGLDPQVRHTVVCVAAEALTNAAKHASGAQIEVRLAATAERLELAVIDDGGHAHDLPSGGRGMDSMAQRVRACGGTFASGPRPDGGWAVRAVLPLSV